MSILCMIMVYLDVMLTVVVSGLASLIERERENLRAAALRRSASGGEGSCCWWLSPSSDSLDSVKFLEKSQSGRRR